jgi:hypothetical protein
MTCDISAECLASLKSTSTWVRSRHFVPVVDRGLAEDSPGKWKARAKAPQREVARGCLNCGRYKPTNKVRLFPLL